MMLEPVVYLRLATEDGEIAVGMERDCQMALRWTPDLEPGPMWDADRERHKGVAVLKQLAAGDAISPAQVHALEDYVNRAIFYYAERPAPVGVIAEANRAAIADLLVVYEALGALS